MFKLEIVTFAIMEIRFQDRQTDKKGIVKFDVCIAS